MGDTAFPGVRRCSGSFAGESRSRRGVRRLGPRAVAMSPFRSMDAADRGDPRRRSRVATHRPRVSNVGARILATVRSDGPYWQTVQIAALQSSSATRISPEQVALVQVSFQQLLPVADAT